MINFIDYKEISLKLELLSDRHEILLKEYLDNKDKLIFKDFTEQHKNSISNTNQAYSINLDTYRDCGEKSLGKNGWHVSALFVQGESFDENIGSLPIMKETLLEINLLSVCALNVLDPGISLDWHFDKDYIKDVQLLRILWGLDITQENTNKCIMQFRDKKTREVVTFDFKNKEFIIFHPMQEHRVENNLSTSRTILCIDYITDQSKANLIFT
jgi:hypothetical protein